MTKHTTVTARSLGKRDIIEVPVETCEIVNKVRVPGQLRDRSSYLVEFTVVPLTGPWAGCEGKFILESSDVMPLVKKYTTKEQRRESWRLFWCRLKEKILGPKIEEVKAITSANFQSTGPMT